MRDNQTSVAIHLTCHDDIYAPLSLVNISDKVRRDVDYLLWASIEQYARDMRVSINNDIVAQMALPHEEHQL